jgi:hypothetical protein
MLPGAAERTGTMGAASESGSRPRASRQRNIGKRRAPRAMTAYQREEPDAFLDSDTAPPNRRSQYRGFRFMRATALAVGLLAIVFGLVDSGRDIVDAFSSSSSLFDHVLWAKLWQGLGTLAKVGLVLVVAALIWRWRRRR